MNKDLESSSDDDDLDDSDDPEKESVETAASNTRPNPAEQILTGSLFFRFQNSFSSIFISNFRRKRSQKSS